MTVQPLAAQLNVRRSQMMIGEVEAVSLGLFDERGFDQVTVEEIAAAAGISVRTFYRYFPTKDAVFQVQIDRRSEALRTALDARPVEEAPLQSLRVALRDTLSREDQLLLRRWTSVVAATPSVLRGVLGGLQLKRNGVIAEFLGARLGVSGSSLVPTMLAAAAGGVIQAAQTEWYLRGVDLVETMSEGLDVLEHGTGWAQAERKA